MSSTKKEARILVIAITFNLTKVQEESCPAALGDLAILASHQLLAYFEGVHRPLCGLVHAVSIGRGQKS